MPNKIIAVCTEDMINDLLLFTLKLVMSMLLLFTSKFVMLTMRIYVKKPNFSINLLIRM